jgi:uncharacterized protein (TIGR03437 family)
VNQVKEVQSMQPKHLSCKLLAVLAFGLVAWRTGLAQAGPPVILQVDLENFVQYFNDVSDPAKLASDPNRTTTTFTITKAFMENVHLADIVAVNGQPVKGTFARRTQFLGYRPAPVAGQSVADISRNGGPSTEFFEILQPDGTPIGTIMGQSLVNGPPPPGSPSALDPNSGSNGVIVGGTGAFLGVRGQCGVVMGTNVRNASEAEDPSLRRVYGGGKMRMILYLIPMFRPEIKSTPTGPAVVHSSDFSLVTANNPAKAGETLSVFITGLGPVRTTVDPGQPFPTDPLAVVNSPVYVTMSGTSADVLGAVGYPGSVDGYQVNFRVPPGTGHGTAQLQVSAAWITSSAVGIVVQ